MNISGTNRSNLGFSGNYCINTNVQTAKKIKDALWEEIESGSPNQREAHVELSDAKVFLTTKHPQFSRYDQMLLYCASSNKLLDGVEMIELEKKLNSAFLKDASQRGMID